MKKNYCEQILLWLKNTWPSIAVMGLCILIWQVIVYVGNVPLWLLPSPTHIIREANTEWGILQSHLYSTIGLILYGFSIGSLVGILIAIILHSISWLRKGVYPLLIVSQNIPIIALAPLMMIWFGFGILPKLLVIMMICFFPISVNLLDGFKQTDRAMVHYLQMIGASKRQIFTKLEFPFALPYLFSGLKISATYSVMGAVIAEWLGASKGIGVYMLLSKNSFQTDHVFIAIGWVIILALSLIGLISWIEKTFIRWQKP